MVAFETNAPRVHYFVCLFVFVLSIVLSKYFLKGRHDELSIFEWVA